MYRCGVVIVAVLSVALGEDVSRTTGSSLSTLPTSTINSEHLSMSDFCFFGVVPSASCRFKCHLKNKDSHCDEGHNNMCLCTSNVEEEVDSGEVFDTQGVAGSTTGTPQLTVALHPVTVTSGNQQNSGQSTESKHHAVFYILDLKKVFGQKQGAQEVSSTAEFDSSQGRPEVMAPAGWNFQDLLALLILILLGVLVVLEIYAFYKKRTANNLTDNLANAIIIPDKM